MLVPVIGGIALTSWTQTEKTDQTMAETAWGQHEEQIGKSGSST